MLRRALQLVENTCREKSKNLSKLVLATLFSPCASLTYRHLYFSSDQRGILLDIIKTANYLKPTMDCPNPKSELLKLANPLTQMNFLKIVVDTRALFKKVLMETQFWGILRAGRGGYYPNHAGLAHVSTLLRYSTTQVYSFEFLAEKI
jgi:hypothetical protein